MISEEEYESALKGLAENAAIIIKEQRKELDHYRMIFGTLLLSNKELHVNLTAVEQYNPATLRYTVVEDVENHKIVYRLEV